jgi:hypothetical protein
MRQLVYSTEGNEAEKIFALWIQKIINRSTRREYLAQEAPEKFIHHVRDTLLMLEDYSKGKAFRDNTSKASEKVVSLKISSSKHVSKPSIPTQLEISLRTRKMHIIVKKTRVI